MYLEKQRSRRNHKNKKRNKKRRKGPLGIGLLLIIFFMVSLQFLPDRGQASGALKPYQITEGETLWTIAESLKDDKEDTRDYIYKLRKINKLEDAHIYPGQIIYYK